MVSEKRKSLWSGSCPGSQVSKTALEAALFRIALRLGHQPETGLLFDERAQTKDVHLPTVSCLDPCAHFIGIYKMSTQFHWRSQLPSLQSPSRGKRPKQPQKGVGGSVGGVCVHRGKEKAKGCGRGARASEAGGGVGVAGAVEALVAGPAGRLPLEVGAVIERRQPALRRRPAAAPSSAGRW